MRPQLGALAIVLTLSASGLAQDRAASPSASVSALLASLEDKNPRVVTDAASQLSALGSSVAPALVGALRERHGCQLQWVASGILSELNLEAHLVTTTLVAIATGKCDGSSPNDLMLKRQAALAVVNRAEAIPVIAAMLTDKDVFLRRSAAFAFDDLTERLDGRPPQIEATTEIVNATTRALPLLLQAALRDSDEVVRCMSYESLDQVRRSTHSSLQPEATRLLEGKTFSCAH